jgi:hypothetical protein
MRRNSAPSRYLPLPDDDQANSAPLRIRLQLDINVNGHLAADAPQEPPTSSRAYLSIQLFHQNRAGKQQGSTQELYAEHSVQGWKMNELHVTPS